MKIDKMPVKQLLRRISNLVSTVGRKNDVRTFGPLAKTCGGVKGKYAELLLIRIKFV